MVSDFLQRHKKSDAEAAIENWYCWTIVFMKQRLTNFIITRKGRNFFLNNDFPTFALLHPIPVRHLWIFFFIKEAILKWEKYVFCTLIDCHKLQNTFKILPTKVLPLLKEQNKIYLLHTHTQAGLICVHELIENEEKKRPPKFHNFST